MIYIYFLLEIQFKFRTSVNFDKYRDIIIDVGNMRYTFFKKQIYYSVKKKYKQINE